MDLSAFLEEFKLEALEHLEKLGSGLLALERAPSDAELIRKLFLSAHTIKGGASMLELRALKTLTHAFEDVLARLREGKDSADAATVSLLLRVTDEIKRIVAVNPTLETPAPETQQLIQALQSRARGEIITEQPKPEPPQPMFLAPTEIIAATTNRAALLEPSDTARLLVKLQLEMLGWVVTECISGAALLSQASSADLVIAPLEPPGGVDGLRLARELRGAHSTLQIALSVLACSAAERLEADGLGVRVVTLTAWNENPFWHWSEHPDGSWSEHPDGSWSEHPDGSWSEHTSGSAV